MLHLRLIGAAAALALVLAGSSTAAAAPRDLDRRASPARDVKRPSPPRRTSIKARTRTTLTVSWARSRDNVAVTAYGLYLNGVRTAAARSRARSATFKALTCGTAYRLGIDARDAAGNRSRQAGIVARTRPCAAPAGTAQLWVDTTGGSCVRRPSPQRWSDAEACSWNQAYQAAQTGDVIRVKGGNYGDVRIGPNRPSIGPPGVTFRTADGERAIVDEFENGIRGGPDGGDNLTFVGPVTARTFRSDQTSNVSVRSWTVDCGGCSGIQTFHVERSEHFTVRDSNIGNNRNAPLVWVSGNDLTFENNLIHDADLTRGSGAHTECMYAWDVTGLTLKRNHFYHCAVMDVFITGSGVANGGFVENNVFEKPWTSYEGSSNGLAFHFRNGGPPSPDPSNWDFRYNTFVGPLSVTTEENPVGAGGMRVVGNVFLSRAPCGHANATYRNNAFVGSPCGANSITHGLPTYLTGFTATGERGDYSLRAGSVLRDRGDPRNYPQLDRSGRARFIGPGPDLGAFEGT